MDLPSLSRPLKPIQTISTVSQSGSPRDRVCSWGEGSGRVEAFPFMGRSEPDSGEREKKEQHHGPALAAAPIANRYRGCSADRVAHPNWEFMAFDFCWGYLAMGAASRRTLCVVFGCLAYRQLPIAYRGFSLLRH